MFRNTSIDSDFLSSLSNYEELFSSSFFKEEEPSYSENIKHIDNVYCSEGQVRFCFLTQFQIAKLGGNILANKSNMEGQLKKRMEI